MTNILDKARAHFANMGRKSVVVPEWGDETGPATIYFDPLNLVARQNIERRANNSSAARLALVVILHAKDADGQRLFSDDAMTRKAFDRELDPAVIARVAAAILDVSEESDLGE